MIEGMQVPWLMVYYGIGLIGILFVFSRFYNHALRKEDFLKLSSYEINLTKYYRRLFTHLCFIPAISIVFVLVFMNVDVTLASIFSGLLYSLTGIVFGINRKWLNKQFT